MPKTSKRSMVKVGAPQITASSTVDAVDLNDNASIATDSETDSEPPAKRVKDESSTIDSSSEPVWEVIEKPSLHTEWTDIPDWKEREDCPLIDRLPVEVLDKIFRVRPELQLVDYLALAGTCRFFRDNMTDDFWEDLAFSECQKYSRSLTCFQSTWSSPVPKPTPHPKAGLNPFSRSIADWKTTHPKIVLDPSSYPVVKSLRTVSKWASEVAKAQDNLVTHGPYTTGHYVPPGPRSKWSRAQCEIYKEEQASWRKDRSDRRLKGLQDLLDEELAVRSGQDWSRPTRCLEGPLDRICMASSDDGNDDAQGDSEQASMELPISSATSTSISQVDAPLAQHGAIIHDISAAATGHMTQTSEDCELANSWQPPVSEPSEPDDEFEWLWERGAKLVNDHWPSPWRSRISQRVNESGIIESRAMRRYRLDKSELSTLKFIKGSHDSYNYGRSYGGRVYRKHAIESHAYKIRGGYEAHEQYVDALFNQEVADTQFKHDEIDRAIEAGEISHTWKPRPRRVAFECCKDDHSMCYCKRCWDGQCECGDYGKWQRSHASLVFVGSRAISDRGRGFCFA